MNSSNINNSPVPSESQGSSTQPHPRDGHIRIPNTVADAFARLRVSGSQAQIIWAVMRKTIGWQKSGEWKNEPYPISLADLNQATGVSRRQLLRELEDLTRRHILTRQARRGRTPLLSLNLDVDSWRVTKLSLVTETALVTELAPEGDRIGTGLVTELSPPTDTKSKLLNKPKETIKKHTKETRGPSTQGLDAQTPAAKYLFEKTSRKRWQNLVQKEQFEKAESEVGEARMKEAIDWALTSGISNIKSIITAARRSKHPGTAPQGEKRKDDPDKYIKGKYGHMVRR